MDCSSLTWNKHKKVKKANSLACGIPQYSGLAVQALDKTVPSTALNVSSEVEYTIFTTHVTYYLENGTHAHHVHTNTLCCGKFILKVCSGYIHSYPQRKNLAETIHSAHIQHECTNWPNSQKPTSIFGMILRLHIYSPILKGDYILACTLSKAFYTKSQD